MLWTVEDKYLCSGGSLWGDGYRISPEQCDDGNNANGDGCSSTWIIEPSFIWSGGSSSIKDTCIAFWGDGLRIGNEQCDYKNSVNVIFRLVWIQHGSVFLDLLKYRSSHINLHFKFNAILFVNFA